MMAGWAQIASPAAPPRLRDRSAERPGAGGLAQEFFHGAGVAVVARSIPAREARGMADGLARRARRAVGHRHRRYGMEQTTVTEPAGLLRVTRSSAVAAQIICPDCISGLRPATW
jgi:hypothetical protein